MVRDEPSANGQQPHAESDPAISQGPQPAPGRVPEFPFGTGNLTQELAQLLAATIAHNQAQRGAGGGVPTGSDLASLASLMQAASAQRTLSPTFKDGLSALSYAPPHSARGQGVQMEHDDAHHDDEPMPIPSTWRQPVQNERDRWFRQQMGAALLGLIAGLMIVVPTVLWLSGWIGTGQKGAATTASTMGDYPKAPEVRAVKVQVRPVEKPGGEPAAQVVTGSVQKQVDQTVSIATAKVQDLQRARTEELLAQAARRIENGDIAGARDLLSGVDAQSLGSATFALAETYDPNMLAAWGTRGAIADVAKARALYTKALSQGVNKAQLRLDALR